MIKKLISVIMVLSFLAFSGCASLGMDDSKLDAKQYFDRYQHVLKLAVQVAVLKVLDSNPTYAPELVAFSDIIKTYVDMEDYVNLDALEELVNEKIDWSKFQPTERLLVQALISEVRVEIENVLKVNVGKIPTPPEDVKMIVESFVDWVSEAAQLYQQQQTNRTVIPVLPARN